MRRIYTPRCPNGHRRNDAEGSRHRRAAYSCISSRLRSHKRRVLNTRKRLKHTGSVGIYAPAELFLFVSLCGCTSPRPSRRPASSESGQLPYRRNAHTPAMSDSHTNSSCRIPMRYGETEGDVEDMGRSITQKMPPDPISITGREAFDSIGSPIAAIASAGGRRFSSPHRARRT